MLCVFIFFLLLGFLLGCLLWCPWACSFVWALRSPCVLSEWPLRQQRGEQATHAGAIWGWSLSFLLCRKLEACPQHGMATSRLSHGSHKTSLASSCPHPSILCAPYGHGPSPFRWQRTRTHRGRSHGLSLSPITPRWLGVGLPLSPWPLQACPRGLHKKSKGPSLPPSHIWALIRH